MIKRTEARALRFALNIRDYELVGIGLGWPSISDFNDVYPLGTTDHDDCGYNWSFTTDGDYNLLSGIHPSNYFRNCYALINLTDADTVIYFKTDPTDKATVTLAGLLAGDSTVSEYSTFNDEPISYPTLLNFRPCTDSLCTQTAQITVTFPTDSEASDVELTYTGGIETTSYGLPSAMALYFQAYFEALGFRAFVSGGRLRVQYNPLTGSNPTNGYEILTTAAFEIQGAEAPYPYNLDTNLVTNEICCTDNYCKSWTLPYGSRFSGFGLFNDVWQYEENALIEYAECDCGDSLQETNGTATAITLTTGETVILHDFTMDILNTNKFQFNLSMVSAGAGVENINRITEDNLFGFGTANFGKFSGTSGDTALNVYPGVGWTATANDSFFGANQILNNGYGTTAPILTQGLMWTIDLNMNNPTSQLYNVQIYLYSKDGMPSDDTVQVYISGATVGINAAAIITAPNDIEIAGCTFVVDAGVQTVTIGLGLSDGAGNIIVSTGTNDYVTVYARVRRVFIDQETVIKGQSTQVFDSCSNCYVKQFEHENTMLENGFPGHLVGGWDIAYPVELEKLNIKNQLDKTEYVTSRGNHIQLNSMSDKQIEYQTEWITEDQADFIYLSFGLTPFLLDNIEYALVDGIEWEKADKLDAYQGGLSLFVNSWNKNRNLC